MRADDTVVTAGGGGGVVELRLWASGDGTLIAYATNRERGNRYNIQVAVVYDPLTGAKVAELPDDSGGRLALSPDGRYVVTGNSDSTALVWRVAERPKK